MRGGSWRHLDAKCWSITMIYFLLSCIPQYFVPWGVNKVVLIMSGFSKWKKVSGRNWKIAGAPMCCASGAGRQSLPCMLWGAFRCIFRTKKLFLNLTHYQEFLENYVYSYILQCFSFQSHVTYYIRIKMDLFPSSVLHWPVIAWIKFWNNYFCNQSFPTYWK